MGREQILTPDRVREWMECTPRQAVKMIRQVPEHWIVNIQVNGKTRHSPRVLESDMLKYLRRRKVTGKIVPLRPKFSGKLDASIAAPGLGKRLFEKVKLKRENAR